MPEINSKILDKMISESKPKTHLAEAVKEIMPVLIEESVERNKEVRKLLKDVAEQKQE